MIWNVALDWLAPTITWDGAETAELPDCVIDTFRPREGAGPLKRIVAVAVTPPATSVGLIRSAAIIGGRTVSVALRTTPFAAAVIVANMSDVTFGVVIVNVALVEPLGITTVDGTMTPFILLSEMGTPSGVAADVSVTVPVAELPPVTKAGSIESVASVA